MTAKSLRYLQVVLYLPNIAQNWSDLQVTTSTHNCTQGNPPTSTDTTNREILLNSSLLLSQWWPSCHCTTMSTSDSPSPEVFNGIVGIISKLVKPLDPRTTWGNVTTSGQEVDKEPGLPVNLHQAKPRGHRYKCVRRMKDEMMEPDWTVAGLHCYSLSHASEFQAAATLSISYIGR